MDLNGLNDLKAQGAAAATEFQQSPPPIPPRTTRSNIHSAAQQFSAAPIYNTGAYGGGIASAAGFGGGSFYGGSGGLTSGGGYYPAGASTYPMTLGSGVAGNSFLRAAEESSRNAFQSIESVVQAFSAVSAMFESTYFAVYNSFRAVVGVADQFYRLKTNLTRILSALAVWHFLKNLAKKLLRLLRLAAAQSTNSNAAEIAGLGGSAGRSGVSDAWSMAVNDTEKYIYDTSKRHTNWPFVMFFAVVVGGPWLIWRILSSIESLNKDDNLWMSGKIDHFVAVAEYDFDAESSEELSFRRGQRITVAPKEYQPRVRGWLLASVDGVNQGIVPANYIRLMGKKLGSNSSKIQSDADNDKKQSN